MWRAGTNGAHTSAKSECKPHSVVPPTASTADSVTAELTNARHGGQRAADAGVNDVERRWRGHDPDQGYDQERELVHEQALSTIT